MKPVFGNALVQGVWQTVTVQFTNPADGDAVSGAVEVAPLDPGSGRRFSSCSVPITLPRGAGSVTVSVPVRILTRTQPDLLVTLRRRGRDGSGDVITYRQFDKIPLSIERMTIAAVSATPDSLAFLNNKRFGLWQTHGILVPRASAMRGGYIPYAGIRNTRSGPPSARVVSVANPADLPLRAAEYEGVGVVFLGADLRPDMLSDAHVTTLRQFAASGGILILASPALAQDKRFRSWVPFVAPGATTAQTRLSRGAVVVLGFDPDAPVPSSQTSNHDTAFWRNLFQNAAFTASPLGLGRGSGLNVPVELAFAVLRAPGLQPPSYRVVGVFLGGYLLLLVPLNYLLLKRLKKREAAWLTIPVLAVLFSIGAYGFGYAIKGNRMLLNTASLAEMQANSGEASIQTVAGLFSPRRTSYRVAFDAPDALVQGFGEEYGSYLTVEPLSVHVDETKGAMVEGFTVAMWAMRPVIGQSNMLRIGDGLEVHLFRTSFNRRLQGTVRNRTGHDLADVSVHTNQYSVNLGSLPAGQQASIGLSGQRVFPYMRSRRRSSSRYRPVPGQSVLQEMQTQLQQAITNRVSQTPLPPGEALITARDDTPLMPVRVNGVSPRNTNHTGLLLVRARVEAK